MALRVPDERLVFVDIETTGGELWRPIMQVAAVAVDSSLKEIERMEIKIRFDESAANPKNLVNSVYRKDVWQKQAVTQKFAIAKFSEFLKRHATVDQSSKTFRVFSVAQLVAHNASFDSKFIWRWFTDHKLFLPASPRVLCTMQRAIWMFHEDKNLTPPPDFKLGTLCNYFAIALDRDEGHDAFNDVLATVRVYRAMAQQDWQPINRARTALTDQIAKTESPWQAQNSG